MNQDNTTKHQYTRSAPENPELISEISLQEPVPCQDKNGYTHSELGYRNRDPKKNKTRKVEVKMVEYPVPEH